MTITAVLPAVVAVRPRGRKGDPGQAGPAGDSFSFTTRAAAAAATIGGTVPFVRTAGYSTVGDGGHALYKRAASQPSHAGKFQSADGAWWELVERRPVIEQFGGVADGLTTKTLNDAALAAMSTFSRPRLGDGAYAFAGNVALTAAGSGLEGNGPDRTTVLIDSTTADGLVTAAGVDSPKIRGFRLGRTSTAIATGVIATAVGLNVANGTNQGDIEDLVIEDHGIGSILGPTNSGAMRRVTIQNCLSTGQWRKPFGANGSMQWQTTDVLIVQCGGDGLLVQATVGSGAGGPAQITMGQDNNLQTFANQGGGKVYLGLPDCPIQSIRDYVGFIGADNNLGPNSGGEYILDTYNTGANAHIISPFVELAGEVAAGPHLVDAQSNTGNGMKITANNFIVQLANPTISGCAGSGIDSSAAHLIISGGSICNNGLYIAGTDRLGIRIRAGSLHITGARIGDSVPSLSQSYGIQLDAGADYCQIRDCDLRNNIFAGILNNSTGVHNEIVNNTGWNNLARKVLLTPGASPWTYTAGAQPETLYISGGTVSTIKYEPSDLGFAPATGTTSIALEPNESVKITYSVVPAAMTAIH